MAVGATEPAKKRLELHVMGLLVHGLGLQAPTIVAGLLWVYASGWRSLLFVQNQSYRVTDLHTQQHLGLHGGQESRDHTPSTFLTLRERSLSVQSPMADFLGDSWHNLAV